MKCSNCGTELGENDVFCPKCGTAIQKKGGNNMQNNNGEMYNYDRPVNQQINNNAQRPNTQNYGQPNMYGQQYGNNGGNGSVVKTCIIIVIIVAILAAVGFVIYSIVSAVNKNNNRSDITNNPTSISTPSTTQTSNNDYGTTTTSSTQRNASTYKVNYGGFKLYIPDDLIYQMDATNDAINIGDALSTWVAQMSIQQLPFQQLKQNKSYLSSYFSEYLSSYNATVSNATVENIDGIEFIIMELKVAGTNELMGLAQLNSMYTACLEVANENNDFDRNVLKNLTSIIRTAEFSGDSKNLEVKGNIKTTDINKALTKAAEEKVSDNNQ